MASSATATEALDQFQRGKTFSASQLHFLAMLTRRRRWPLRRKHETGTEALTVLVNKLDGYDGWEHRGGPAWPVLFWLHSTTREAHLHRRLTEARPVVPVATEARDRIGRRDLAPARKYRTADAVG